jgi:DNA polymerase III sliding clamp (beta) subunit (PCNA family)
MKITVNRQNLQNIVAVASTVVPTRTTLAALTGVLLRFADGTLSANGSDLASFAVANCKAEGDDMEFGVSAGLLSHFLSTCVFTCGNKRATLTVIDGKEFGLPPEVVGGCIMVNARLLHESISHVMHCVAEESSGLEKPVLASVLFDFSKGGLHVFATDGKQIAFVKLDINGKGAYPVPRKLVGHILKLIDGVGGEIEVAVTFTERAIQVESDFWTLTGSLLEGQFPNWPNVVPQSTDKIEVQREDVANALKSCMPFGDAGFTRITLEGGTNTIKFKSGQGNECQDEITAKCAPFKLAIEGKRLLNLINSLHGDVITIERNNNPEQPPTVLVREDNFTGVCMPLR